MDQSLLMALFLGIFGVAVLYSCVGHGGASGYIAVMTLFGISPLVIKPTALMLNIIVALIATWQFHRAGYFRWPLFWPFALTSIPAAFLGGLSTLPMVWYRYLVVLLLWFSAARLCIRPATPAAETHLPPLKPALATGAALGLLSGLIGVGGGIFLSPLLILMGWAGAKQTSAVAAMFILVNSCAGLWGYVIAGHAIQGSVWQAFLAALGGGLIGSYLGCHRLPAPLIRRALSIVLVLAGCKLLFA